MTDKEKQLLEKLYIQHAELLRIRAYRITEDMGVSFDIVHDCIINAAGHIDELIKLSEMKQKRYLAVTVDNLSKNYVMRHKARIIPTESNWIFAKKISAEDPEEIAEKHIEYKQVRQEILRLNERDRKAIEMKYILRLHDRIIASALGIKEDSVRMTVRRSIFRLKKQMGIIRKHETIM